MVAVDQSVSADVRFGAVAARARGGRTIQGPHHIAPGYIPQGDDHPQAGEDPDAVGQERAAGGLFGGYLTRRARVESVGVSFSTNDAAKAADFLPQFSDAMSVLGPPQFCDRDTVAKDLARAVMLGATAIWRRGNVTVMLDMGMNTMNTVEKYKDFFRRFSVGYDAWRSSDTFHSGELPTRHDSPCFFTEAEIRDRAVPLDSATYEAWRTRVRKWPP